MGLGAGGMATACPLGKEGKDGVARLEVGRFMGGDRDTG